MALSGPTWIDFSQDGELLPLDAQYIVQIRGVEDGRAKTVLVIRQQGKVRIESLVDGTVDEARARLEAKGWTEQ